MGYNPAKPSLSGCPLNQKRSPQMVISLSSPRCLSLTCAFFEKIVTTVIASHLATTAKHLPDFKRNDKKKPYKNKVTNSLDIISNSFVLSFSLLWAIHST